MSKKSSVRLATAAGATVFMVIVGVMFWPDLEQGPRDFTNPAEAQSPASSGRSVAEQ